MTHFQPGNPRSVEDTRASIMRQFELAFKGDASGIKNERRQTAVRDPIATEIINDLLQKAKELTDASNRNPSAAGIPHSPEEIAQHLEAWLKSQPGDHMSPLLDWCGMWLPSPSATCSV